MAASSVSAVKLSVPAVSAKERPFKPFFSRLRNSFGYLSSESSSESEISDTSDSEGGLSPKLGPVKLPECWGHRGASAAYPENTLASFEQAILDGAEGIESDVHISLDGTIVMFHDAYLNRTTNGKGLISKQAYKGGIDALRTTKLPAQRICTLEETLSLLMRPGSQHVSLNVDVKLDNDPEVLFKLMDKIIQSYDEWQTKLAPRLVLGLWHAKYIEPAQRLLPYCKLAHIGISPAVAKKFFWDACTAFSLNYSSLVGKEGEEFRKACQASGKDLYVWTVNNRSEMIQATNWGVKAILTDKTADLLNLRGQMKVNYEKVSKEVGWSHSWSNLYYFTPVNQIYAAWELFQMERTAGPMALPMKPSAQPLPAIAVVPASNTSVQ